MNIIYVQNTPENMDALQCIVVLGDDAIFSVLPIINRMRDIGLAYACTSHTYMILSNE